MGHLQGFPELRLCEESATTRRKKGLVTGLGRGCGAARWLAAAGLPCGRGWLLPCSAGLLRAEGGLFCARGLPCAGRLEEGPCAEFLGGRASLSPFSI